MSKTSKTGTNISAGGQRSKDFASGASASINKTISEIESVYGKAGDSDNAAKLRDKLHDSLEKLSKDWFEYGFSHGYSEAVWRSESGEPIPKKITAKRTLKFGLDREKESDVSFEVKVYRKKKKTS